MISESRSNKRKQMVDYFRQEAAKQLSNNNRQISIEEFFVGSNNKKILFVIPESIGDIFLCTALFKSVKELYPTYDFFIATKEENMSIFDGNPYIYKVIPYMQIMEDIYFMEGRGTHKGLVDIVLLPHIGTQRFIDYHHNAQDKIAFNNIYEGVCTTIN